MFSLTNWLEGQQSENDQSLKTGRIIDYFLMAVALVVPLTVLGITWFVIIKGLID